MAKRSPLTAAGLALLASLSLAASSPWGNLKKIYFYEASGNLGEVRQNLDRLDAQALPPAEKIELMKKLAELGDRYYQKNDYPLAEAFYRKTLAHSPQDAWPHLQQAGKDLPAPRGIFWNFANVGRQFASGDARLQRLPAPAERFLQRADVLGAAALFPGRGRPGHPLLQAGRP